MQQPYGRPPQYRPPPRKPASPYLALWIAVGVVVLAVIVGGVGMGLKAAGIVKDAPSPSPVAAVSASAPAKPKQPPTAVHVTRKQYGAEWPFTHITAGTVVCIPRDGGIGEVIFTPDGGGRAFGLNGTALDAGYADIPAREWRKDPAIPGASVSIAPLRDPVAKACGL